LTQLRVCLINRKSSMRNHPHQRKLRRSFGSQPVGSIGGPRQPEAGIAIQVTQAQSSSCTFLRSDDGDLATSRIWSRVTTGFRPAHSAPATTSAFPPPSVRTSRGSPQPHLMTTPSIPIQSNHPSVSLDFNASHRLAAVKPHLSSLKQRRTYKIKLIKN